MKRPAASASPSSSASSATQLTSFIAKFDAKNARLIRAARRALSARFPSANQLVYDNYNFFVIGFCTTERPSDCMFSIAAQAKGVSLSFYYGATLPDPDKLLQGSGNQNRFIRLESEKTLAEPGVTKLLNAALQQSKSPLPSFGKGRTIIRSVSAKQRPRRNPA